MDIYKVNGIPTQDKIEMYDDDNGTYYRFQCKDWEMGTKSWGMIYSSSEEAIEDGSTILDGKSACYTADNLWDFAQFYDDDFRVLVLEGSRVEEGHDGEDVIDVYKVLEIWDYNDFINCMISLEDC